MNDERERVELPAASLTEREQEILGLVGQGWTNQQIADELVVAHSTVRWYLRQIYAKLGVAGREEAVARARRLGLTPGSALHPRTSTNLPAARTPFIGRQGELLALNELLADRHVRLVTIVGPGGIGKTRLALALAERQVARQVPGSNQLMFPDGVWYARLAPLEAPAQVVSAVADALGMQEARDKDVAARPGQQVLGHLRRKRLLLVLDNFEHVAEAAPFLTEIMTAAPDVKLLVASRQRLRLQGEHVYALAGLQLPQSEQAAEMTAVPAVRLFVETAHRVQPALAPDETSLAAIGRICRLLDGTPLAIELAASWASVLPPEGIEREVQRGLDILAAELADLPPRHQSMQATLDVSWARLEKVAQDVLRQLSVFRGGFSRDAAENIAGATLPVLRTLVDASWLSHDPLEDRYHVQELVRQYAEGKLLGAPDLDQAARERHAVYFAAFLHEREPDWFCPRQAEALAEVGREIDNLRRAWRWAIQHSAIALMTQGLESLRNYYDRGGNESEMHDLLYAASESVLARADVVDDDVARRRLLARLLIMRTRFGGTVEKNWVALDQARVVLEDLQWANLDVRHEQAFLAMQIGNTECDFDPAREAVLDAFERARTLFAEVRDEAHAALLMTRTATAERARGNNERAVALANQALEMHRTLGDAIGMARDLRLLAPEAWAANRLAEAQEMCHEALDLVRTRDRWTAASVAAILAEVTIWTGAFSEARKAARDSLQLADNLASDGLDRHLNYVALLPALHAGAYEKARRLATQAVVYQAWTFTGALSVAQGQLELAAGAYEAARVQFEQAAALRTPAHFLIPALPQVLTAYPLLKMDAVARAGRALTQGLVRNVNPPLDFIVINALPAAALLFAQAGDALRAVEFYAFACTFPYVANSRWFEDVAGRELAELAASLPAADVAAAQERGRARALWATVEELVAAFSNDAD